MESPDEAVQPLVPVARMQLSRKAKAAVVVRLLLNEGADIPLEDLPESLQVQLTKAMGNMRMVDRDTLMAIVSEFVDEVEQIGLRFPGGIAGALNALDGKISPSTAERLRKEAGVRQMGDPWQHVRTAGVDQLVPIMETEATEVAAVLLSKLDVKTAAELLSNLPGPRARQITYAVSLTGAVTPDAVDRIGVSIAMQLNNRPINAFDGSPVERIGAILNSSTSATREDMLDGLNESDEAVATEVRKAIFTFANIPQRLAPGDVPRALRVINQDRLIVAIAGAPAMQLDNVIDFIMESISTRMANGLREEAEDIDAPSPEDAEAAMADVVAGIRELEANGEISLIAPED